MSLTVGEFRDRVPNFDEMQAGDEISVDDTVYTISDKEVRSPGPGETVYHLHLREDDDEFVVAWGSGHTSERLWIHPRGSDPMTNGTAITEIDYRRQPTPEE